jgi:hypothetical protein
MSICGAGRARLVYRKGYGLEDQGIGVPFPTGADMFLVSKASRTTVGPAQPIDIGGLFPGSEGIGAQS